MRSTLLSILILATGLPVLANHGRCESRGEWHRGPERHSEYREDCRPERRYWGHREYWRREHYRRHGGTEVYFAPPRPVFIAPPEPPPLPVPRIQVWLGF